MRVGELLAVTEDDVNLDEQYIDVKRSKTKAGIRKVPIADKILPLIPVWFTTRHYGGPHTQTYYLNTLWPRGIRKLGIEHYSHDCRHTCATLLTELGISSEIRHAILGHSTGDVEEKVYTHIQLKTMLDAVNMLP